MAVDSDYRGPVIIALHNDSKEIRTVEHGERIAQLIVLPYYNGTTLNHMMNAPKYLFEQLKDLYFEDLFDTRICDY